jgi:hypothetical protein
LKLRSYPRNISKSGLHSFNKCIYLGSLMNESL